MPSLFRMSIALFLMTGFMCTAHSQAPTPAPVREYAIHEDGGIVYDPLRREAEATGQLTKYTGISGKEVRVERDGIALTARVPETATAYDAVPIPYSLTWTDDTAPTFPVAVEATAFEEEKLRKGRDLYDLALPGRMDLSIEYLGSITAHVNGNARHVMTPDNTDTPAASYPAFERKPKVRSGVVEAGDIVWFQFRYTNTGNTILDPEGIGGWTMWHEILRKGADGVYTPFGQPYNLYNRDLTYVYPGESRDIWVHFQMNDPETRTPQNWGVPAGEYKINFRAAYRWYKDFNAFVNIWDGPIWYAWEMPIAVEKTGRDVPVADGVVTLTNHEVMGADHITRWIHTHEEFMTAFDCHIAIPETAKATRRIDGVLYLQIAPWTTQAVLKLITNSTGGISTLAVPITVESDSLQIAFDPDHTENIIKDGMLYPVIYSQIMADMRTNIQIGPWPERHIPERLEEMKAHGINVMATTAMPWMYDSIDPNSRHQGDAWRYALDCARDLGLRVEGWGSYPFDRANLRDIATWISGDQREYKMSVPWAISHADPNIAWANATAWIFQFTRWGDLYYQMPSGEVPISVEDSRGWMRQDVNIRYPMGPDTIVAFREWLQAKYGAIEAVNTAWNSSYASFDAIDPEANQVRNDFGHLWEYTDTTNPFHDWSAAVMDLDIFRTEQRIKNYRDTLDLVRPVIPNAKTLIRTEGGNVLVSGLAPDDANPHFRHIYYSQRRCGLIADIIQSSGLVRWHSDYTTMPYTPTELRFLVERAVGQGVIPVYLPQFDNMRDIAINTTYGTDFQRHYNLPEPRKGMMMHTLTALYPWFQAVYESGGVPGILWEDLQCDGFATETQKKEMRFFHEKLEKALNTPEAKAARTAGVQHPDQEWREKSLAKRSYLTTVPVNPQGEKIASGTSQ